MITYEKKEPETKNNVFARIEFGDREKDAFKKVYKEMLSFMNLRIKYDKEMQAAVEEKCWDEIARDAFSIEELVEQDYYDMTLRDYIRPVEDEWSDIDFDHELEKVAIALEEEMVDFIIREYSHWYSFQ